MRGVDFFAKFISVHSMIYLNSNTQKKQKQKLAKNEIQKQKRIWLCCGKTFCLCIFFLSEIKNSKQQEYQKRSVRCLHTTGQLK